MEFGAGVVEARNSAADVAEFGGLAFGLHGHVADDVDALAWCSVFEGDPGAPDRADIADRRAVQACHGSAGPAQEDVGQRGLLPVAGTLVDVEHDLPRGAGLDPVEVTDRQHCPQAGQVGAVGVTVVDVPGQGAEALPETGGPAWPASNAAARADRLAVASLEIGTLHAPVGHRGRSRSGHHMPPIWPGLAI